MAHGAVSTILLLLLPTLIIAVQVIVHHKVKKVTNNYWFWWAISIAYLVFFVARVWAPYVIELAQHPIQIMPGGTLSREDSRLISWVFGTDLCHFIAMVMPILLLIDPSRKHARAFAPSAMVGSIVTLVTRIALGKDSVFTAEYIFWGFDGNELFYFYHCFNLILAVGVLLNTPKFGKQGLVQIIIAQASYYLYVGIIILITGANHFVAGLTLQDFDPTPLAAGGTIGNFGMFAKILGNNQIAAIILFHIITCGLAVCFWALNDYVFKKYKWWKYGNVRCETWFWGYDYNKFQKDQWLFTRLKQQRKKEA